MFSDPVWIPGVTLTAWLETRRTEETFSRKDAQAKEVAKFP